MSNRIDNEMSMFQLILKFGESVKLEDFAVDYTFCELFITKSFLTKME